VQKYAAELAVAKKQQEKAKLFDSFVAAEKVRVKGLCFDDHTMETLKWQHDGFLSSAAYAGLGSFSRVYRDGRSLCLK